MTYTNEMKALLIYAVQTSSLLERRPLLKQLGLPAWLLLRLLAENGAQSFSQLARMRGLSRQSVHKQVQLLQGYGWVKVADNPDDRRAKLVRLSSDGLAQIEKVERDLDQLAQTLQRTMDHDDIDAALVPMSALVASLEEVLCK